MATLLHRLARRAGQAGPVAAALLLAGCAGAGPGSTTVLPCDKTLGVDEAGCRAVQAMRLPDQLPPSRGNAHADSPAAASFGFQIFFRKELGKGVSCATCHDPTFSFTDRRSVSKGAAVSTRNAPTTLNAARLDVLFWDGRADSLWSQPLFAIENPNEMAASRVELAKFIAGDAALRPLYEAEFGPMPDLSRLPAAGKPGDPAFDSLSAQDKDLVNRIAANTGKAFEAYERLNTSGMAPIDRYLDGDTTAIIDEAKKGLALFVTKGCADCHSGPMFTDQKFYALGLPLLPGAAPDPGAAAGLETLQSNIFNLAGPYADPTGLPTTPGPRVSDVKVGSFRTPSLRNVGQTAPYGHNGVFANLHDLLVFHAPDATDEERGRLLAFLQTLTGETPPRPWSTWPSPQ